VKLPEKEENLSEFVETAFMCAHLLIDEIQKIKLSPLSVQKGIKQRQAAAELLQLAVALNFLLCSLYMWGGPVSLPLPDPAGKWHSLCCVLPAAAS